MSINLQLGFIRVRLPKRSSEAGNAVKPPHRLDEAEQAENTHGLSDARIRNHSTASLQKSRYVHLIDCLLPHHHFVARRPCIPSSSGFPSGKRSCPWRNHPQRRNHQRLHALLLWRLADQQLQRPFSRRRADHVPTDDLVRRLREGGAPSLATGGAIRATQLLRYNDSVVEGHTKGYVGRAVVGPRMAPAGDCCSAS